MPPRPSSPSTAEPRARRRALALTVAGNRRERAAATLLGGCGVVLWATEKGLITLAGRLPLLETMALAFAVAALPTPLLWRLSGTGPRAALRQPLRVWLVTVA